MRNVSGITALATISLLISSCGGLPTKIAMGGVRNILKEDTKEIVHTELEPFKHDINHLTYLVKTLKEHNEMIVNLMQHFVTEKRNRFASIEDRVRMVEETLIANSLNRRRR